MRTLSALGRRLRALFRRRRVDAEIAEELRFHFEMAVADGIRRGLPAADAEHAARRQFGGMLQAREGYRDALGVRLADQLVQDARYALRSLRRTPTFTVVALATLALGIGASTAVFSVVERVLLRPLPFDEPERVVLLWETDRESGTTREPASIPDYFDYAERARGFAAVGAFAEIQANVDDGDGGADRVAAALITRPLFAALGVRPTLGRVFTAAEDAPGAPRVAVVSERFWRTRLGGRADAIGRTIRLDDSATTVVGVLPGDVRFPRAETDVWMAARVGPTAMPRSRHAMTMVGRLRATTTLDAARREMTALAAQLEREHPRDNRARGVNVEPIGDVLVGSARAPLYLLLGAVLLLTLIACANTASLLLARHAARVREVAVRSAIGAGRSRLVQQFAVEGLVLALGGTLLGVALAAAGVRALVAVAPAGLPRVDEVRIDGVVLAATLALAAVVAIAFALVPVLGGGIGEVREALAAATPRSTGTRAHRRMRRALVVGEVALALVLALGATLLVRSFERLRGVDPGFRTSGLVRLRFQLPASRYPQSFADYPRGMARIIEFERELEARARALPGAIDAAVAANDPLSAGFTNSFVIAGREEEAARGQPELATRPVSAGYFATVGIPVLRGRDFSVADRAGSAPVVIVNEAAARRFFAGMDPIGKRIRFWGTWREVVGVVGNERFAGLAAEPPPAMYPPIAQAPLPAATLLVRVRGSAAAAVPRVREVVRALDPGVAAYDVASMDEALSESVARERFTTLLLAAFATTALLLALAGIYGVMAYTVVQRVPEIGVRVALGATRGVVMGEVVREGVRLAATGVALGLAVGLAAAGVLASQLYGIAPRDPATVAGVAAAVIVVGVAAAWIPARRAAGVSPMEALKGSL